MAASFEGPFDGTQSPSQPCICHHWYMASLCTTLPLLPQVPERSTASMGSSRYSVFKRADLASSAARRIWCVSPLNSKLLPSQFPANQLTPLHAATLLRPERDAIVLPGARDARDFWAFVKALLGLEDEQASRTFCLLVSTLGTHLVAIAVSSLTRLPETFRAGNLDRGTQHLPAHGYGCTCGGPAQGGHRTGGQGAGLRHRSVYT